MFARERRKSPGCIAAFWAMGGLKNVDARGNSARPYFPLNLLLYLQQMNDAEILHLKSVA